MTAVLQYKHQTFSTCENRQVTREDQ